MTKGASTAVLRFMRYEERLIELADKDSNRRREFVIRTTKALRFTVCSIVTRKRKRIHKQRSMN